MAFFGCSALCVVIVLFAIFPPAHSQIDYPLNPDELTGPIESAILHSLDEYNDRIEKHPHEANFLAAMAMHDLYSNDTFNGGNDYDYNRIKSNWNTVANWFRLCGVNLSANAFEADLNFTGITLDRQFSVRPRPKGFGNFYSDIDSLYYQEVVMKWRNEMEKSKFDEHLLEPKEMYKRMVELAVSLLWKWQQMILVGSYFEQVTLAELLDPFCDIGDITTLSFTEALPLCFNYLLCSLAYVNVTHTQTTETRSLTTYLSSIFPKDNVSLQLELINQKECGKNRFQKLFKAILFGDEDANVEMIVPEVMQHFVVKLMANSSNTIPFKINQKENQVALTFNGAIDWFMSDFNMYLAGKEFSLDSISDQKIVYYLILHTQSEQYKLKVSRGRLYIFIILCFIVPILVLSVLQIILIIRREYTTKTPKDKVNLLP